METDRRRLPDRLGLNRTTTCVCIGYSLGRNGMALDGRLDHTPLNYHAIT
jgi:hypothetical protein